MSALDKIRGMTPARASVIRKVVREKFDLGEPLTLANVGLALIAETNLTFGELGEDELAAAVAELEQPVAEMSKAEPLSGDTAEAEPVETLPTMGELNEATKQNANALVSARRIVLDSQQAQRLARNAFTAACTAFERGGKPITREQMQREYIASEQAHKQAIADGTIEPPRLAGRGRSVIDQQAGRDERASSFVQRRMRHGSHHRPVWINGKCYAVGRPTAPKLPSER